MGRLVLPDYIGGALPASVASPIAGVGETSPHRGKAMRADFLPMKPYVVPARNDRNRYCRRRSRVRLRSSRAAARASTGSKCMRPMAISSTSSCSPPPIGGTMSTAVALKTGSVAARSARGCRLPKCPPGGWASGSPNQRAQGRGRRGSRRLGRASRPDRRQDGACLHSPDRAHRIRVHGEPEKPVIARVRAAFSGVTIQIGSFDGASADACIASGEADAVSFGGRTSPIPILSAACARACRFPSRTSISRMSVRSRATPTTWNFRGDSRHAAAFAVPVRRAQVLLGNLAVAPAGSWP